MRCAAVIYLPRRKLLIHVQSLRRPFAKGRTPGPWWKSLLAGGLWRGWPRAPALGNAPRCLVRCDGHLSRLQDYNQPPHACEGKAPSSFKSSKKTSGRLVWGGLYCCGVLAHRHNNKKPRICAPRFNTKPSALGYTTIVKYCHTPILAVTP